MQISHLILAKFAKFPLRFLKTQSISTTRTCFQRLANKAHFQNLDLLRLIYVTPALAAGNAWGAEEHKFTCTLALLLRNVRVAFSPSKVSGRLITTFEAVSRIHDLPLAFLSYLKINTSDSFLIVESQ